MTELEGWGRTRFHHENGGNWVTNLGNSASFSPFVKFFLKRKLWDIFCMLQISCNIYPQVLKVTGAWKIPDLCSSQIQCPAAADWMCTRRCCYQHCMIIHFTPNLVIQSLTWIMIFSCGRLDRIGEIAKPNEVPQNSAPSYQISILNTPFSDIDQAKWKESLLYHLSSTGTTASL